MFGVMHNPVLSSLLEVLESGAIKPLGVCFRVAVGLEVLQAIY